MDEEILEIDDADTARTPHSTGGVVTQNFKRTSIIMPTTGTNGIDEYNYLGNEPKEKKAVKAI